MIDTIVKTAMLDHTLFEGLAHAWRTHDTGKPIITDALGTTLTYRKLILGAQVLSRKLEAGTAVGENIGVLLPNSAGVAVVLMALQTIGRVPAMLNFSAGAVNVLAAMKAAQVKTVLTSRAFIEKGKLDKLVSAIGAEASLVYLEDVRTTVGIADKIKGLLAGTAPRVSRSSQRSRRDPVHLGLGRHAEGRRAVPPQHPRQRRAGAGAGRCQRQRQGVQRAAGVPLVRPDRRVDDAAARRHPDLHVSVAAALSHRSGADLPDRRDHPVRHRHVPDRLRPLGACRTTSTPCGSCSPARKP